MPLISRLLTVDVNQLVDGTCTEGKGKGKDVDLYSTSSCKLSYRIISYRIVYKTPLTRISSLKLSRRAVQNNNDMTFFSYLEQQWLHAKNMQNGIVRLVK